MHFQIFLNVFIKFFKYISLKLKLLSPLQKKRVSQKVSQKVKKKKGGRTWYLTSKEAQALVLSPVKQINKNQNFLGQDNIQYSRIQDDAILAGTTLISMTLPWILSSEAHPLSTRMIQYIQLLMQ